MPSSASRRASGRSGRSWGVGDRAPSSSPTARCGASSASTGRSARGSGLAPQHREPRPHDARHHLPDFKYAEGDKAARYSSGAESYPELTKRGLLEMHRQVGVARPSADGLMYRGLMIRHLVMPNDVGGTRQVVEWIAANLPRDTYVNLMSQYRPMHRAREYPEIARRLTREEYEQAVRWAREAGLTNLEVQGWPS